ncbi:unnamed protein product [Malus baccata var. baccata]
MEWKAAGESEARKNNEDGQQAALGSEKTVQKPGRAKFKENKQLVNDARKMSKALADAICVKDQNFESLKRRNGENMRLKKKLEVTKKQFETIILEEFLGSLSFHDAFRPHCIRVANFEKRKWMVVLGHYDNGSIIQQYGDEMDEYRQNGETFVLVVNSSSEDDSDNEASISEQSQESEDGPGDAEDDGDGDGVETQSDIVRGSPSDKDDS